MEEEKRKLDEEKKEISRKRQQDKKLKDSRKRSRSKSEETVKPKRKEKSVATGDLRKRLDDMKKSPEKKAKKTNLNGAISKYVLTNLHNFRPSLFYSS